MAGKNWLVLGAVLGFGGVALGAFGAHGLEGLFKSWELPAADQAKRLQNWDVAVRYQMYHVAAILVVGCLASRCQTRWLDAAGALFGLGVLVFSGCLYAYALSGLRILGLIVPLGGTAFLVGWLALAARFAAKN
jgi:uncharacterized membrane protein YgdD (TMEM256/DUF423 family)